MSDQSSPGVQAGAEGEAQGSEETNNGSGLYDLESAPEQYRPYIEAELKKIEGNVGKKLQDAAEFRKQWDAYGELGLTDVPVEQVQELLQLREIAQDPEAFDSWLKDMAESRGILGGDEPDLEGDDEEDDGEDVDIAALVREQVEQAMSPLMQQFQSQQQEQTITQELDRANKELDSIAQKAGLELSPDDRSDVLALAYPYAEDDPDNAIQRGFEAYQRIQGNGARGLVESKANQPMGSVGEGQASSAPDKINGFEDAMKAARERFRTSS